MKKKAKSFILITSVVLSLFGCASEKTTEADNTEIGLIREEEIIEEPIEDTEEVPESKVETIAEPKEETSEEEQQTENEESGEDEKIIYGESYVFPDFSFADLRYSEFCFSSGVGGWATLLTVCADGSFSGEYYDGDLGVTGENYPNGTMYQCVFNGQFTQPVKINDYTYSVQISKLHYEHEVDTEAIIDGVRYIYTDIYGFNDAENILIYLPGAPMSELPEEFKSWLYTSDTELQYYALNNESCQQGFYSYGIIERLKGSFNTTIWYEGYIEEYMKDEELTQSEYSELTERLYKEWDSRLNDVWSVLKQTQDAETMRALTVEERQWIAMKEQAVAEAGTEYADKTTQEIVMNQKAAELTKERVYELMELFE